MLKYTIGGAALGHAMKSDMVLPNNSTREFTKKGGIWFEYQTGQARTAVF